MSKPYFSVIIPAYNEAKRISKTLVDIDKKLSEVTYDYEIIVVSDGSTDNTAEVVQSFLGAIKNLKLIDNKENHGKGAAVRQGMLEANGIIRLFTDADNSTSIDQFNLMIPYFSSGGGETGSGTKERYDVVIGSRAVKGSVLDPAEPWYRALPGKMGNILIQLLLLPGIWDTQCGFKAFSEEAAMKIFGAMKTTRWSFDVEALALAKHFGYRLKEVPVHWVNDPFSHVKPSAYLQFLLETFKIRWWFWNYKKYYKSESRS